MNDKATKIKHVALFGVSLAAGSVVSTLIGSRVPAADTVVKQVVRWVGVFAVGTAATRIVDREFAGFVNELEEDIVTGWTEAQQ